MGLWATDGKHNTGLGIHLNIQFDETSKALGSPRFVETELRSTAEKDGHTLAPMPYYTDALVGLSAYKLLVHSKEDLSSNEEALAALLWQRLEPMHEVYHRSSQRISDLLSSKSSNPNSELVFEQALRETLKSACGPRGTQLKAFFPLLEAFNQLELQRSHPLLFDTKLQLSASSLSMLHTLYSLLYNLRALTAIHYNTNCSEPLFEALQLDSVKDYFHAPDLLTHDSMLYHHVLILRQNHQLNGQSDEALAKAFMTYLPHSHFLVNSLPEHFFSNKSEEQLANSLYSFQVDWLLGSPAGLLYRIRDELVGLKEGYDQSFWPELNGETTLEPLNVLKVNCVLGSEHIRQLSEVA